MSDEPREEADNNPAQVKDEKKQLCPNCGFANLEYDENGELSCTVCNYGKTRRHT